MTVINCDGAREVENWRKLPQCVGNSAAATEGEGECWGVNGEKRRLVKGESVKFLHQKEQEANRIFPFEVALTTLGNAQWKRNQEIRYEAIRCK